MKSEKHEHLHLFEDGLRYFVHAHPYPANDADVEAARKHRHKNGSHLHPHGHSQYKPLPNGWKRRPIIPVGEK